MIYAERIISNFKQVELPKEDYERLTSYGKANAVRFNTPSVVNKPKWDINIFEEPSEANTAHKVKIV
jgi:L-glyceraldehyde reductase